jgi:hypothetical protein
MEKSSTMKRKLVMKRTLMALAIGLCMTTAYANGNETDCSIGAIGSNSCGNSVENRNNRDSFNTTNTGDTNITSQGGNASQEQGQRQGQRQSQGNSQSVTLNTPRQAVPAAGVSAAGTTAVCRIAGGVSVGAVWGGFGVSGSVLDETCQSIEIAKALIWAGSNTGNVEMIQLGNHILLEVAKGLVKPVVASTPMSHSPFEVSPQ